MGNDLRGEVVLKLGDEQFILRFTNNVIANVEDALGIYGAVLAQALVRPSVRTIRAVLCCALNTPLDRGAKAHKPNLTLHEMGFLMDEYGRDYLAETYWLLMVHGGIVLRANAEKAGLIPKEKAALTEEKRPAKTKLSKLIKNEAAKTAST